MFQKYADALSLMDATIAAKDDIDAVQVAWDKLYTFIFPNFVCPQSVLNGESVFTIKPQAEFEAEVEEMVVMFAKDRDTLETELRKIPPVIAEVAFPVYIARHLLRDHRLSVHPEKITTFDEFYNRYGYIVINGANRTRK